MTNDVISERKLESGPGSYTIKCSAWFLGHLSLGFDRDRAGQIEDWA